MLRGTVAHLACAGVTSYLTTSIGQAIGDNSVTPELAAAVRKLVVADSATQVAAGAVQACEQLSQHLARIIGEIGVRTLLARSAALASVRFPWLASAIPRTAPAASP